MVAVWILVDASEMKNVPQVRSVMSSTKNASMMLNAAVMKTAPMDPPAWGHCAASSTDVDETISAMQESSVRFRRASACLAPTVLMMGIATLRMHVQRRPVVPDPGEKPSACSVHHPTQTAAHRVSDARSVRCVTSKALFA